MVKKKNSIIIVVNLNIKQEIKFNLKKNQYNNYQINYIHG